MREFLHREAPSGDLAPDCFYTSMEKTLHPQAGGES